MGSIGVVAMKIVVLVKQVPDSGLERGLQADPPTLDRSSVDNVINEMDEYAIEEGRRLQEEHDAELVLITMGPLGAEETIRKALQRGGDGAVHIVDDALAGSCALATSRVLAAAVALQRPDLVLCGAESTDGRGQVMAHMLAERLGLAAVTGARKLTVTVLPPGPEPADQVFTGIEPTRIEVTVERQLEDGYEVVTAAGPVLVSVWDTINQPRLPSFKAILAARGKMIHRIGIADLGIDPQEVGLPGASSQVLEHSRRPAGRAGVRVVDTGDGATQLVDYLAAEKVL